MAKLRVLGENLPPSRGNSEEQIRELRDYLTRLKDELEFLLTHLGKDNLDGDLAGYLRQIRTNTEEISEIEGDVLEIEGDISDINTALAGKQDTLTFDDAPTSGSSNPVKSGGVYTALSGKQNALTFDNSPTEDSQNPVKSGGVYTALAGKQNTLTFDDYPASSSSNPVKSGGVYIELAKKEIRVVDCGTLSNSNPNSNTGFAASLTYTKGNEYELIGYDLGNPDALYGDLDVSLDNTGFLTVTGRIIGSTTLRLYFGRTYTAT